MLDAIVLPNVRKVFTLDPGHVLIDGDLKGADAQVVAWEAEDEDLKAAFRAGLDVHVKNAEDMWGSEFARLPEGSYARKKKRQENKQAVHATNYGGSARTLAMVLGWTVHAADQFQKRWFSLHPGIRTNFQGRIRAALNASRTVYNRYGFRRVYFDRPDECFGEALAWVPQSTVAITTYIGAKQLQEAFPDLPWPKQWLIQCHDNLVFQMPKNRPWTYKKIAEALRVHTPYPDPLYIPWDLSHSEVSWGDCHKIKELEAA